MITRQPGTSCGGIEVPALVDLQSETAPTLGAAHDTKELQVKPFMKYGGIVASVILIALGIGAIITGLNGRSEVRNTLKQEQIVGTPDMDKQIANKPVDTGAKAKLFADGMRGHALEATGGQVYSQMGRYLTATGKPTNDEKAAAVNKETGKPVENGARNLWVTETALSTALNTSYFAESVATFAIVMGFAMFLIGIGFLVMVYRLPWETAKAAERTRAPATKVAAGTA
jgi:putative Mn2+ efflux pump MntP